MYTVLLADDEESVLEVLKSSIAWQELGVDTLLTAPDGQAALELFEKEQIDLLVTDIRMPRMDGLELIRRVRERYPDTHCILLTAYGEFEYAKQAIRLGVENYLLKPVAKEEFEQNIQNALNNIYQKRHSSESLLRENTLRRWLAGTIGEEELSERATVLGLNLYRMNYCIVCLQRKGSDSLTGLRNACVEELSREQDVNTVWDEKGRFVLILGGRHIDTVALGAQIEKLAADTGTTGAVAVAIGTPVTQASELHDSYRSACDAITLASQTNRRIILPQAEDMQDTNADQLAEEIRILYYIPEAEARAAGYRHLAGKLCGETVSPEQFAHLIRGIQLTLTREFPLENDLSTRVWNAIACDSWPTAHEEAMAAMTNALAQARETFAACFAAFSPIVQRTIMYVRDSVMSGQSVSLKEFCVQNGMSSAYLGHTFKTETGTFFNDYLMQCRIERASVLLRNPNRMIKDISDSVGFSNVSYFVKCFREQKGVSPAKYRQELQEKGRGTV